MSEQNTAHGDPMPDYLSEPHPFDGQFEPPAEAIAKGNPTIALPEIALASIAISMKRIADAMTEYDQYGQTGSAAISCAIRDGLREGRP